MSVKRRGTKIQRIVEDFEILYKQHPYIFEIKSIEVWRNHRALMKDLKSLIDERSTDDWLYYLADIFERSAEEYKDTKYNHRDEYDDKNETY